MSRACPSLGLSPIRPIAWDRSRRSFTTPESAPRERRIETGDGLEHVFAVTVLGTYLLTALIKPPKRLVYLSSGMHRYAEPAFTDLQWKRRRRNGSPAYSDSKLFGAALAFAVARLRPATPAQPADHAWAP